MGHRVWVKRDCFIRRAISSRCDAGIQLFSQISMPAVIPPVPCLVFTRIDPCMISVVTSWDTVPCFNP